MMGPFHLKISCVDRPGIIASITAFIHGELGGNILDLHHHSEEAEGTFFLLCIFSLAEEKSRTIHAFQNLEAHPRFLELSRLYGWEYQALDMGVRARLAIMVTQTDHCLYELILKLRDGYLRAHLACVISNQERLSEVARRFDVPFHHCPISEGRKIQEIHLREILEREGVDTLVLARYMQILSPEFTQTWKNRIINVHHGFLPAFKGARPYHQAWEKGVKIIGATAHYATESLDEGPIIYQDVTPVRNNLSIREFIEAGRDIERKAIVEGLKLHLENRVFVRNGRTVIL